MSERTNRPPKRKPTPKRPSRRRPSPRSRSSLKASLRNRLDGAPRLALLAVGSEFRGDDAAGLLVAQLLASKLGRSRRIRIFLGETAPENLTGEIKRYKPTHMVIVDTADINGHPGAVAVLNSTDIATETSFCTHSLPLSVMVRYFQEHFPCEVTVVGIQPEVLTFGQPMTPAVRRAATQVAADLYAAVHG